MFVKEKPTVGSPFFGEFPSDRIPKAMKDFKHILLYLQLLNHRFHRSEFLIIIPAYSKNF
jgi:hypothetical protein